MGFFRAGIMVNLSDEGCELWTSLSHKVRELVYCTGNSYLGIKKY